MKDSVVKIFEDKNVLTRFFMSQFGIPVASMKLSAENSNLTPLQIAESDSIRPPDTFADITVVSKSKVTPDAIHILFKISFNISSSKSF